jgi:hypothetical protein
MKIIATVLMFLLYFNSNQKTDDNITCNSQACWGTYKGPEFIKGDDIAHQFSNTMSARVGIQLKKLYAKKKYSKVDFALIKMSTAGMGSGKVEYYLYIPFTRVSEPCDAYTSFDHVGGWNHAPALKQRIKQLQSALMKNESLDISPLKTTLGGLQEHWIQWRNKITQKNCEKE